MCFATEQTLIFLQGLFDLRVSRQNGSIDYTESLGGLALGEEEIANAVLGHHPSGLLSERSAKIFGARRKLFHDYESENGFNGRFVRTPRVYRRIPGRTAHRQSIEHEGLEDGLRIVSACEFAGDG